MDWRNKITKLSSVHPLVKTDFWARLAALYIVLIPFFIIAYEMNFGANIYFIFISQTLIWPYIAYFIASRSSNQKEVERWFNCNLDLVIYSIWIPKASFNPMFVLLLLVTLVAGGLTAGGFLLLFTRFLSAIFGTAIGIMMFGLSYSSEISLPIMISTSIAILIISGAQAYLAYNTGKKIIFTRKLLKEQKMELEKELAEAADYVKSMLPAPINDGVINVDWKFVPSAILGGDAFGYHWLDRDNFAIYLLDVCGHGVGAALLSASVLNVIRSQSLDNTDFHNPSKVFQQLNTAFQGEKHSNMFFTMWYGVYNINSRILNYSSAGHPPAFMFTPESETKSAIKLMARNYVIGGLDDITYIQRSQQIGTGTSIYVYSDGVYEIEKTNGSMLNLLEFERLLIDQLEKAQQPLDNFYRHCLKITDKKRYEDDYTILKITFS